MPALAGSQSSGRVYEAGDDGLWHWIPDLATFNALGLDWSAITWYGSEDGLPGGIGDDLPAAAASAAPAATAPSGPTIAGLPELVGLPDGRVFLLDNGVYRHIPDPPTLAALGFAWSQITWLDALPGSAGPDVPGQTPAPPPPPPPPAPPATPAAASGAVAPADSFSWGGRTWRSGDLTAFLGYLAAHGVVYADWANNHPAAAAILEGPPVDPAMQPVPKSLGEALAAAVAAGDTPAEAAATAEALRAALVAQGVSSVTPEQLAADAATIAQNYAAAQGTPLPDAAPVVASADDSGGRSLLAVDAGQRANADLANLPPIPAGFRAIFNGLVSEGLVVSAALIEHADPWVTIGTCKAESSFNVEHGKNSAGAVGPMQVVGYPAYDGSVPEVVWVWGNLIAGARMLARYGVIYDGDQQKISAAYNAGEGAVNSHWPSVLQYQEVAGHPAAGTVQDYVDKVGGYAAEYAQRFGGGWNIDPTTGQLISGVPITAAPAAPPAPRYAPAGVLSQWRALVGVFKTTVPAKRDAVSSLNESMRKVFE